MRERRPEPIKLRHEAFKRTWHRQDAGRAPAWASSVRQEKGLAGGGAAVACRRRRRRHTSQVGVGVGGVFAFAEAPAVGLVEKGAVEHVAAHDVLRPTPDPPPSLSTSPLLFPSSCSSSSFSSVLRTPGGSALAHRAALVQGRLLLRPPPLALRVVQSSRLEEMDSPTHRPIHQSIHYLI